MQPTPASLYLHTTRDITTIRDDYWPDRYPQSNHGEGARWVNKVPSKCEQGGLRV
jgi:hypothetical protein